MTTPVPVSDEQLHGELYSTFGYASFRPLQQEVVRAILDRRDVFVLMPTGGGKSLCYQLPALLSQGLTVVVSPLIALMKDQVDALQALGVAATFVNSSLDSSEIGRRQAAVARGQVKLLYAAPERLMAPGFLHLLASANVTCFAIDEAHCISEWGHDFRPEYRELRALRDLFPATTLGAFTATATSRVQADIIAQLGLQKAASFRGSFNRPNLFYQVWPKDRPYEQLVAYLRQRRDASGIVYCQTRAGTESLAASLQADGFSAAAYHAGLAPGERRQTQEAFVKDDVHIIVATIAFGMGIDKPDVRFVVHYDLPKNLEGYYQESGRAGRDGEPSDCILIYKPGDAVKQRYFIDQKPPAEQKVALAQLRAMVDWAEGAQCRRRALLAYFDEQLSQQVDACCDRCRDPAPLQDCTVPAQMLLSCARRTGERFGITYLIDVLRGSQNARVIQFKHHQLPTHGVGRDRTKEDWQRIAYALLREGYVRQAEDEFNAVKVTEKGQAVLFRGEKAMLLVPPAAQPKAVAQSDLPHHQPLFERLRALRKRLADEAGLPPYVIFHDSTLRHLAAALPRNTEELLRIPGVGTRKALDYGEPFLAAIAQFVQETGAQPVSAPTRDQQYEPQLWRTRQSGSS